MSPREFLMDVVSDPCSIRRCPPRMTVWPLRPTSDHQTPTRRSRVSTRASLLARAASSASRSGTWSAYPSRLYVAKS